MKLTDLDPSFHKYEIRIETWNEVIGDPATWKLGDPTKQVTGPKHYLVRTEKLEEAQGIQFQCPKCINTDGHYCEVTFANRNVPDELGSHNKAGRPTRWTVTGNNFNDLTTQPSILLEGGCNWHGYITNGEVSII